MARRGRRAWGNKTCSVLKQPQQEEALRDTPTPAALEGMKRFERPLPKGADGLTSSGDVILAREIKPQDGRYPEYLRERAISALIELERMAYKNFEEAIALATAAVHATDAILSLPHPEAPGSRTAAAAPPVVEELSSSSGGSGDFEGFLQELLRLLSLDFAREMRAPLQQQQQQQQQRQQHEQQKTLQRLDLLQHLASTEPKDIKDALLHRDRDTSGALHLSLLERLSNGEDSESLHLSLLEKLSFSDDAVEPEAPAKKPPTQMAPGGGTAGPKGGSKKESGALTIRQQLLQQEESGESLHLSLLERIGSLSELPAERGCSSEALHLSLLFGRGISREEPASPETTSAGSPGAPICKEVKKIAEKRPVSAKEITTQTASRTSAAPLRGPQVTTPRGGTSARQQFGTRAPGSPGSSSSCSGSSDSCDWVPESTCGFKDTETQPAPFHKAAQKSHRGRKATGGASRGAFQAAPTVVAACTKTPQDQQEQRGMKPPSDADNDTSALRSTSPMPHTRRPTASAPGAASAGGGAFVGGAFVEGTTRSPPQLQSVAAVRERRPASAASQSGMNPEAFWDLFYSRTSRKMLADTQPDVQPSPPTSLSAPVAAAPRPATPSPGALRGPQSPQRQKPTWVWLDSESSLDIPCPGGCGSRCEERPDDAESPDVSSSDSRQVGPCPLLAVRGIPLQQQLHQQQQQQGQQQQETRVRVAGPVEANGRPPFLLQGPIPMVAAMPLPGPPVAAADAAIPQQQPQHQQPTAPTYGGPAVQQTSSRRKNRGRKRRSSARQRR